MDELHLSTPISNVVLPLSGQVLSIKRDDVIHPVVCGNKIRKLKGWIERYRAGNYSTIVTCGGWYSNHIHAVAYYCFQNNIPCYVLLPQRNIDSTYVIDDIRPWIQDIKILAPHEYRRLQQQPEQVTSLFSAEKVLFVPEGGKGKLAEVGLKELAHELNGHSFEILALAMGTGTTAAYLNKHLNNNIQLYGISMFLDGGIKDNLQFLYPEHNVNILYNSDLGRFGRITSKIIDYLELFESSNEDILLDPIYTVKLCFTIDQMLMNNKTLLSKKILLYHSGGLQARRSL